MTEVMVHSSVGENCSDSTFKNIQSESRSQLLSDKSTVVLKENMDVGSGKSSESTNCESNSNTIPVFANDVQGSSIRTTKKNILIEYEATETTVINTTCDIISRTTYRGKKKASFEDQLNSADSVMTGTNKSRVVVQMLSSDTKKSVKSHNTIENKSTNPENQSTHCFREDVCKMLSKQQHSKLNIVNNDRIEKAAPYTKAQGRRKVHTSQMRNHENKKISDVLNVLNKSQVIPSPINGSSQIERNRRKRGFRSYALFGKSAKISEIEPVTSRLNMATENALRMVHYVLFDRYGPIKTKLEVLETKRKILNFCGYPFNKSSNEYIKRTNCLHKMPRPVLFEIHRSVFGKTCIKSRILIIQHLMEFFMKPSKYNKVRQKITQTEDAMSDSENNKLKRIAAQGPLPSVLVQKLTMMDVKKIKNEIKLESIQLKAQEQQHKVQVNEEVFQKDENVIQNNDGSESIYSLPAYILKGPGEKLKFFPSIVRNVRKANEKDVSLLHYILYGRTETESVEVCRKNILEFSGFLECQTQFIAERRITLLRLDERDLFELCKILSLQVSTNSRVYRIKKIMDYLMSPFNPSEIKKKNYKEYTKAPVYKRHSSLSSSKCPVFTSNESKKSKDKHARLLLHKHKSASGFKCSIVKPNESGIKVCDTKSSKKIESDEGCCSLRDIKAICFNIECSAPSDLAELNDLLFVKPCDDTVIHEKILNFTRFLFVDNSVQYFYRKNLLFYMGPCLVRKIAKLLDIENFDVEPSIGNLSSNILKFLMKKKIVDSPVTKSSASTLPSFISSFNEKPKGQEKVLQPVILQNEKEKAIPCDKGSGFINSITNSEKSESNSNDKALMPTRDNMPIISDDESPITSACTDEKKEIVPNIDCFKDDSIPLRVFIHHPTDQELKHVIHAVINKDLWHVTLGELVQKVYDQYPQFNLQYRENFIKDEARQILSELRNNAFNVVQLMKLKEFSS